MKAKKVIVHKMYENFHILPIIQYSGWFNENNMLIKLFDNRNKELLKIQDTSQWKSTYTGDIYFVESDYDFFQKI